MKTILCVDLDQTLLKRDEEAFLPVSMAELCRFITSIPQNQCQSRMSTAIGQMVYRKNITPTLYEVFLSAFCDGNDRAKSESEFLSYYKNQYRTLQQYTSVIPEAIDFIREAFDKGFEIAIATNPIYPLNAIEQRLDWAGLADYSDRFRFITTMENFHFTKPNPAYYTEILGRLGWPEDARIVMIGDSLEMDIIPSSKAGIPSYWLSDLQVPEGLHPLCRSGNYQGIFSWIDRVNSQYEESDSREAGIDLLANLKATPAVFDSIWRSISDEIGAQRPDIAEWSLIEIICHLRDADQDVNLPRFEMMLGKENPFITHIDMSSWSDERKYTEENGYGALQKFTDNRLKLIQMLAEHRSEWNMKTARHSIFGPVTIFDLVQFILTHDRMHIRQAYETIEKINASYKPLTER